MIQNKADEKGNVVRTIERTVEESVCYREQYEIEGQKSQIGKVSSGQGLNMLTL